MTNLEYTVVIKELQSLIGSHLENIYSHATQIRLKMGGKDIICEAGIRLHTTKYIEKDEELSSFATTLRQHIRNLKLRALYLHNNDRIIVFDLGDIKLILEMFAKGNIILVENGNTIASLKQEEWSDRVIARNKPYAFPKSNVKLTVRDALSNSTKYLVVALLQLPLGKEYVLALLRRAHIDEKKQANTLTEKEITELENEHSHLLKNARPYGIYENDKIISASLLTDPSSASKEFPTLNDALDEYYFYNKEVKNEKLEKLAKRLEEQEKRLSLLKEEELETKKVGDYLYAEYEKIEKLLKTLQETSLNELESKFPHIKINKKEKEVELEL